MASEADERALHVALPEAELLPRQVNKLLRDIAERAASRLEATSPARAARVRQASAHGIRHTLVTTLVEHDVPVKSIMKTTGHADERTFRRYHQRPRQDQHRDVTRIFDDAEGSA